MADASVRPARLSDVAHVVALQRRVWDEPDAGSFALTPVSELDSDAMVRAWERAVLLPPTPRHRLLVALVDDRVVGVVATTVSEDPDLDQLADELVLLVVDQDHRRAGHGSRLINAVADLARETSVETLSVWLPSAADPVRRYFESFGWGPDGAYRSVEVMLEGDAVKTVRELRYETSLR